MRSKYYPRDITVESYSSDLNAAIASKSIEDQFLSVTLRLVVVRIVEGSECFWSNISQTTILIVEDVSLRELINDPSCDSSIVKV